METGTKVGRLSPDTKWIVGVLIAVATILSAQIAGVNARIDDPWEEPKRDIDPLREELKGDIGSLREEVSKLDARLRTVEVALGRIDRNFRTVPAAAEQPAATAARTGKGPGAGTRPLARVADR